MELILKKHLDKYFDSLIEYKHVASRTNKILFNDLERYTNKDSVLHFSSSLILRDWSGKTANGWSYAYPTDSMLYTTKEDYPLFVKDMILKQFCLLYAQSFEGLERFLKNLLFELKDIDLDLKAILESELNRN